jgi:tripartite-type tricarboxylate transporter receptor subunit TctC
MSSDSTDRQCIRRRLVAALASLPFVVPLHAQTSSPAITLIVPAPAGVSNDQLGRIVADALARILEVRVRIENVGGDGGVTGTNTIATSAKDGTILGLGISTAMVGGRLLSRGAKFNPIDDFQWFTIFGTYPAVMVVPANTPHETIASWLAAAREASTPLAYASIGTGSAGHLAGGYLRVAQGARIVHRSIEAPDERYALLAKGEIAALFDDLPNARVAAPRSGHRIVAVTSAARSPLLADVPAFGELWQQSFESWVGLVAPRGLNDYAYYRLASAIGVLLGDARFIDSMRAAGVNFLGLSGRGTVAFLDTEILRGAKAIALLNDEGMRN